MKCGKKCLLGLVLLWLLSLPVFSDGAIYPEKAPAEMTDQEIIMELLENLTERENETNRRAAILEQRELLIEEREKRLQQRESAIAGIETYWMSLISDMEKRKGNEYWRGFISGLSIGVGIGSTGGVAIGFTLSIKL